MSIQEFHSQLTQADPPDPIIASLSRLTLIDEALLASQLPETGWSWGGGATFSPS
jgi:hypothetical protein